MTHPDLSPSLPAPAPRVTVIVTSYNYAPFVRAAIDSVLDQPYGDFELIVVDDGSSDDSPAILKSLRDPRLFVQLQANRGQAAAWNAAFEKARGELVMFLDSDDYWLPEKISSVVAAHDLLGGRYGLIQHNLMVERGGQRYLYRRTLRSGDCFGHMRATGDFNFFVTTSGLAFSAAVLRKIFPLPEQLRISPDAYLTRTAFVYGPVFSLPQPLAVLRLHGNNAGMLQGQAFHDALRAEKIFPALNAYYREHGIDYQFALPRPSWVQRVRRAMRF
jgi:glycosyltransferase involved in cell wall biosynthesis